MNRLATLAVAVVGFAALVGGFAAPGAAQNKFPSKAITIIVPFTAGSGDDLLAREIGAKLSEKLGQAVIVENKVGAGGAIGAAYVARAAADGYTILLTSPAVLTEKVLKKEPAYDFDKQLTPLAFGVEIPYGAVVSGDKYKTIQEFFAYVKANPGKVNFASAGAGSSSQLFVALLSKMAGLQMVEVPYPGMPPLVTALIANQVQISVAPVVSFPLGDPKQMTLLAVATEKRVPNLPNVPTIAESGVPGYSTNGWFHFFAPAATPVPVLELLNKSINEITALPELQKHWESQYEYPNPMSLADYRKYIAKEQDNYAKMADAAHVVKQ